MASIPMEYGLLLAGTLFALGLIGVLVRRNIVFILMSLEIMLNATGLAFVTAGARWAHADGQVMYLFILSMAAAEVAVEIGRASCRDRVWWAGVMWDWEKRGKECEG